MIVLISSLSIAFAECDIEPTVVDDILPGEEIELNASCDQIEELEECSWKIDSTSGGSTIGVRHGFRLSSRPKFSLGAGLEGRQTVVRGLVLHALVVVRLVLERERMELPPVVPPV